MFGLHSYNLNFATSILHFLLKECDKSNIIVNFAAL